MRIRPERLLRAWKRRALILLYHRISEADVDPWELAVRPDHFREHLDVVKRCAKPLSLPELMLSIERGRVQRRGVVITFDDGYADNLQSARPLLEAEGVPATAFIAAGPMQTGESFWWDQLAGVLLTPGELPTALRLEIGNQVHEWTLAGSTRYSADELRRDRRWRPWRADRPTLRHDLYVRLFHLLRPLRESVRSAALARLRRWAGREDLSRLESARPLSCEEVAALGRDDLVGIGAHTMTHPQLASLDEGEKIEEISRSREKLEEVAGRPVTSFAYPFGRPGDYDDRSIEAVRRAGFTAACANVPGLVTRQSDAFELPRFHVPDVDGAGLERRLRSWLAA